MARKTTPDLGNLAEMLNDASIDRIMALDAGWKIIAWNKAAEKVSGIHKESIIGKPLLDVFPLLKEDEEIIDAIKNAFEGYTSFLPAKQGVSHRHYYENHFIPLVDEDGRNAGVMNIMHDVSHRVKTERQLEKLNAELKEKFKQLERVNAEVATFTSITGSDLKEPLKKIYTSLELIIKNDGPRFSDSSKAALRRMQTSINRMNILLDDILALSTSNAVTQEFSEVNTEQLLNAVIQSVHKKVEEKNASIKISSIPRITASAQMLHYLFHNLIDNALKFQPSEQIPIIEIKGATASVKTKDAVETSMIRISIADNGIGFEQGQSTRIFQLFEKLPSKERYPGSGIGLSICQKIMEAHHGFIEVTSSPGQGSTFACYFPNVSGN